MNIDESFVKGQHGSNRLVFYNFFAVPQFRKLLITRFTGQYGSSADDTVHSVKWTIWFIMTNRVGTLKLY